MDQLERIRLMGMESSTRCKLDDKEYITWEEREELGRYIFSSPNLEELCRRYIEVGDLNISREITYIRRNIENNIRYPSRSIGYLNRFTSIEREIIRYLGELNRRELFRKLPLKDELYKLINIGIEVSSYRDILQGEGVIDLKILSLY